MSGVEVLGAVAAARQFAATALKTYRTCMDEYEKYHTAAQKLMELGASVDSIDAVLSVVHMKAELYYMQEALDQEPTWARAAASALNTTQSLLQTINVLLHDAHVRLEWRKKLRHWSEADKIKEYARRLDQVRLNLEAVLTSPPLNTTVPTDDYVRLKMYALFDYESTNPTQHSLVKNEAVIKVGNTVYNWAKVEKEVDGRRLVKKVPASYLTVSAPKTS